MPFKRLEDMDKFLDSEEAFKLNKNETKHLNRPTTIKGIEMVIKSSPKQKPSHRWAYRRVFQIFKDFLILLRKGGKTEIFVVCFLFVSVAELMMLRAYASSVLKDHT